uniref:CSON013018 protein n=1 Tax=Culicoides sonorensis TaxID=179676 RepID=A0A336LKF4_CULSO
MDGHEIDCLNDINSKYATLEVQLEQKLAEIKKSEQEFISKYNHDNKSQISSGSQLTDNQNLDYESACKRNHEILKKLEKFKARFRSKATYSPVQAQLDKLKMLYRGKLEQESSNLNSSKSNSLSIPTSIKKTYGPTFV